MPPSNSAVISAGVSGEASAGVQIPVAVLPVKSAVIGRTTPPFTPIAALWKWAAVIAPESPSTVTLNARPAGDSWNVPVPSAPVATAGSSWLPVSVAVNVTPGAAEGWLMVSCPRISPPGFAAVCRLM